MLAVAETPKILGLALVLVLFSPWASAQSIATALQETGTPVPWPHPAVRYVGDECRALITDSLQALDLYNTPRDLGAVGARFKMPEETWAEYLDTWLPKARALGCYRFEVDDAARFIYDMTQHLIAHSLELVVESSAPHYVIQSWDDIAARAMLELDYLITRNEVLAFVVLHYR